MTFFIKNLVLTLCCIYYFTKLLHLSISKPTRIKFSILAVLLSLFSIGIDKYYPYITIPFLILSIIISLYTQTKTSLPICFTTTTIAFAFSCIILGISSMIAGIVFINIYESSIHIWAQLLCCIIQLLIMPLPFRLKRLQNGMPFLQKEIYAFPGMIISILVLSITTLIVYLESYTLSIFRLVPIFILSVLSFLILYYWQKNLTKTYLDKVKERNLLDLNVTISEQLKQIEMLKEDNERLSKIVHRDNKLIPAMEYAVYTYLQSRSVTDETFVTTGEELLEDLTKLSEERKGILRQQDIQCRHLTPTHVLRVDNVLNYMQRKANMHNIELHTNISCDMQYFTEHVISEDNLSTLLADLLENAIIATKHNNGHYILLSICILADVYTISVFDSGIPFTMDVLEKWGIEQITTHADDGGSGIGMMTTHDILKTYNASFIIHELGNDNQTYTKEVTISFNKTNQYILQTNRLESEIEALSQREGLQIIRQ